MLLPDAHQTTRLLNRYASGEAVEDELLALVYDDLHRLAAAFMRDQAGVHTLQPTALIHEAWMRLARQEDLRFDARSQFFRLASKVMRSVLVDHARRKARDKRGGGCERLTLDPALDAEDRCTQDEVDLLDLDDALSRLEGIEPELARVVELRFFGGLSHPEIARATGCSLRTVERSWRTARAWLQANLEP